MTDTSQNENRIPSRHLYLCGYRGCGKTTVAKLLSQTLGREWVDTDDVVEETAGRSIADIFAQEGEAGFRDRETVALRSVSAQQPQVIALGGGAVLREENRSLIAGAGYSIWLRASVETLADRIRSDNETQARRPSLTGRGVDEEVREVLSQREAIYRAAADAVVDVDDKSPNEIATEIIEMIRRD